MKLWRDGWWVIWNTESEYAASCRIEQRTNESEQRTSPKHGSYKVINGFFLRQWHIGIREDGLGSLLISSSIVFGDIALDSLCAQ
jgi:hypothetical protein